MIVVYGIQSKKLIYTQFILFVVYNEYNANALNDQDDAKGKYV